MDLKECDSVDLDAAKNHWYYNSKAEIIANALNAGGLTPEIILDIGAGSGFFSDYLLTTTSARHAYCVDINYQNEYDAKTSTGKMISFRKNVHTTEANLVILMDILEHVDDDAAFLKDWSAKAPANASFLITVPAFQFLWSYHDVFLEHRRRYTINSLETTLDRAGLTATSIFYCFSTIFPLAIITRILLKPFNREKTQRSQIARHGKFINRVMNLYCALERPVMKYNKLAGLTVCCLACKCGDD